MSNISYRGTLRGTIYRGAGTGTTDYTQLSNKPQINGHTLQGNQTGDDLDLIDKGSLKINGHTLNGNQTGDDLDLIDKGSLKINGHTLNGNQTGDDLDLIDNNNLQFNVGYASNILHNIKYNDNLYNVYAEPFNGASSGGNGTMGLVPAPVSSQGDYDKYLKGNGRWASIPSNIIDYSTTEVNTKQKWIDGKDIYQITITGTKGTSDVNHSMPSGFNDNEIIEIEGVLEVSSGDVVKLGYFNTSSDKFNGYFNKTNNRFVIFASTLQGTYKLTFKYVKP